MRRVFLALPLPEAACAALTLQQVLLPLPRRVAPDSLHLTLVFLGKTPPEVLQAVHESWNALHLPALTLHIQGFGLYGDDRPRSCHARIAPNPVLMTLQAKVEEAARSAGATPEHRCFVPHVTLGNFPPPPVDAALRLERAVALGEGFRLPPFSVSEMVLYESHLSDKGPRYDALARYPLTA